MKFDLLTFAVENPRSAGRAEVAAVIHPRLTRDPHMRVQIDRRSLEKSAVILSAIEAMADADAIRLAVCLEPHLAANATACDVRHFLPPSLLAAQEMAAAFATAIIELEIGGSVV